MNCPHCKNEIESKDLPNETHTIAYKIIFNNLGWCFPENTEAHIYRRILSSTASAITKAFMDLVEDVYDSEFQFSYEQEEMQEQEDMLNKKIKTLEHQIKSLKKKLKTKGTKK